MNWDLFGLLYGHLATPVLSSVAAMNAALAGPVAGVLKAALVLFIAGSLLLRMFRPTALPLADLTVLLLGGAAAVWLVSNATYGTYVRDLVLTGLSKELPALVSGSTGARAIDASAFAELWGKAWVAGLQVYRNLPWGWSAIGLSIVVVVFWFCAIFATAFAFAVWLKGTLFLALLVGVGMLFVPLWVFPWTRGWFWGWLNTVAANLVLMVLTVGLLSLLIAAETQLLAQVSGGAAGGNEVSGVGNLLAGVVIFALAGWLTYQLPGTAAAITHGFAGFGGALGAGPLVGLFRGKGGGGDPPPPPLPPPSPPGAGQPASPPALPGPARAPAPPGASLSNRTP